MFAFLRSKLHPLLVIHYFLWLPVKSRAIAVPLALVIRACCPGHFALRAQCLGHFAFRSSDLVAGCRFGDTVHPPVKFVVLFSPVSSLIRVDTLIVQLLHGHQSCFSFTVKARRCFAAQWPFTHLLPWTRICIRLQSQLLSVCFRACYGHDVVSVARSSRFAFADNYTHSTSTEPFKKGGHFVGHLVRAKCWSTRTRLAVQRR